MKLRTLVMVVGMVGAGCAGQTSQSLHNAPTDCVPNDSSLLPRRALSRQIAANADFTDQLNRTGSLTFRSNEGQWMSMDGDTDLKFYKSGKVEMIENSLGMMSYFGSYRFDWHGDLVIELENYTGSWPIMRLSRGSRSLLLNRAGPAWTGFCGLATNPLLPNDDRDCYGFPFRPVKEDIGR